MVREVHEFKGKVNIMPAPRGREGYLLKIIKGEEDFVVGLAKRIPDYIKEGLTTTISYINDGKDNQVVGYTIP